LKGVYSPLWETQSRATERHLPYVGSHSVTCHLTQVDAPRLNPSQTDRYSRYSIFVHLEGWKAELTLVLVIEFQYSKLSFQ